MRAVVSAANSGVVPEEYQNTQSLSELANFVLQGTRIDDPSLQAIGIRITQEVTNNYRGGPYDTVNLESGLDNFPSSIFIIDDNIQSESKDE